MTWLRTSWFFFRYLPGEALRSLREVMHDLFFAGDTPARKALLGSLALDALVSLGVGWVFGWAWAPFVFLGYVFFVPVASSLIVSVMNVSAASGRGIPPSVLRESTEAFSSASAHRVYLDDVTVSGVSLDEDLVRVTLEYLSQRSVLLDEDARPYKDDVLLSLPSPFVVTFLPSEGLVRHSVESLEFVAAVCEVGSVEVYLVAEDGSHVRESISFSFPSWSRTFD